MDSTQPGIHPFNSSYESEWFPRVKNVFSFRIYHCWRPSLHCLDFSVDETLDKLNLSKPCSLCSRLCNCMYYSMTFITK